MEPAASREAQARAGGLRAVCSRQESPGEDEDDEAGERTAQCGTAGGAESRKESEEELDPRIQAGF